jgi:hypothetical protein
MMVVKCKQAGRQNISASMKLRNQDEEVSNKAIKAQTKACITYTSIMNKYKALAFLLAMLK